MVSQVNGVIISICYIKSSMIIGEVLEKKNKNKNKSVGREKRKNRIKIIGEKRK